MIMHSQLTGKMQTKEEELQLANEKINMLEQLLAFERKVRGGFVEDASASQQTPQGKGMLTTQACRELMGEDPDELHDEEPASSTAGPAEAEQRGAGKGPRWSVGAKLGDMSFWFGNRSKTPGSNAGEPTKPPASCEPSALAASLMTPPRPAEARGVGNLAGRLYEDVVIDTSAVDDGAPQPMGLQLMQMQDGPGVYVSNVTPDSPASRAGLKVGHVIASVGDDEMMSKQLPDVVSAISASGPRVRIGALLASSFKTPPRGGLGDAEHAELRQSCAAATAAPTSLADAAGPATETRQDDAEEALEGAVGVTSLRELLGSTRITMTSFFDDAGDADGDDGGAAELVLEPALAEPVHEADTPALGQEASATAAANEAEAPREVPVAAAVPAPLAGPTPAQLMLPRKDRDGDMVAAKIEAEAAALISLTPAVGHAGRSAIQTAQTGTTAGHFQTSHGFMVKQSNSDDDVYQATLKAARDATNNAEAVLLERAAAGKDITAARLVLKSASTFEASLPGGMARSSEMLTHNDPPSATPSSVQKATTKERPRPKPKWKLELEAEVRAEKEKRKKRKEEEQAAFALHRSKMEKVQQRRQRGQARMKEAYDQKHIREAFVEVGANEIADQDVKPAPPTRPPNASRPAWNVPSKKKVQTNSEKTIRVPEPEPEPESPKMERKSLMRSVMGMLPSTGEFVFRTTGIPRRAGSDTAKEIPAAKPKTAKAKSPKKAKRSIKQDPPQNAAVRSPGGGKRVAYRPRVGDYTTAC